MAGIDMKDILIKANRKLVFALLGFLALIPVVLILNYVHILNYSMDKQIIFCVVILLLSVVPFIVNKKSYNEVLGASFNLYCLEAFMLIIALNPIVELSFVFFVAPVVSLIYLNRALLHKMLVISFSGMVIVIGTKTAWIALNQLETASELNDRYMSLLYQAVELIVISIVLIKVYEIMDKFVSDANNAAMLEKYMFENRQKEGDSGATVEAPSAKTMALEDSYDVQQFFSSIVSDMNAMTKGKSKYFSLDLDKHMPVTLYGKKESLKSALINICSDLLMYHTKSEVNMYVTYDNEINPRKKQNITLIIRIDSNAVLNKTAADKAALGYFLSKKIIDELDGNFVEINENGQTTFKIRLLQRVENELTIEQRQNLQLSGLQQIKQDAIISKAEGALFKSKVRVLVVDDNKENRKLMDSIMSAEKIDVVSVKSGVECIELLKEKGFDLVFVDQMMPDKSGVETVKEIRFLDDEYYQKLPIVMMSVHSKDDEANHYAQYGFTDSISKPVKVSEINSCLRKWIKDDYPYSYEEYMRMQNAGEA